MKKYFIFLSAFPAIGPKRLKLLLEYFGSAKNIWWAKRSDLLATGLSGNLVSEFIRFRSSFDETGYLQKLKSLNIKAITIFDNEYPSSLKEIENPPIVLYLKGKLLSHDKKAIAIVGSRKMSSYGKDMAENFTNALARCGITIVSGLARGIDTTAHKEALKACGRTIAVIGSGLDRIYPPENVSLAKEIIESGSCILSEYPLGYPAFASNFPARNRIISGLSKAVVVVEGRQKSGTLLTAASAAEQGKDVYAIPGQVNSALSEAPHYLLLNGAKLAIKPEDILDDLGWDNTFNNINSGVKSLGSEDAKVLNVLNEPLHLDELTRLLLIDVGDLTSKLTLMELKGLVKNLGGGVYRKI